MAVHGFVPWVLTRYVHDVDVHVVAPQDDEGYEHDWEPGYDPEDAVAQGSATRPQFEAKRHSL